MFVSIHSMSACFCHMSFLVAKVTESECVLYFSILLVLWSGSPHAEQYEVGLLFFKPFPL